MQKNQHLNKHCNLKNNSHNYHDITSNDTTNNMKTELNFVTNNKLFVYHLLNRISNHN